MEDEEEEEDEVILEEGNIDSEPQIDLRKGEGGVTVEELAPGPSRTTETPPPLDEEKAGLDLLLL